MEEKLKLILKRIHWSLVLKAAIFAAAWFFLLPAAWGWLFVIIALGLYFIPFAGSATVALPFLVFLYISVLQHVDIPFIIIFGFLFYFILLIKDLFIIDRRSAYEILILMLSYILFRGFFESVGGNFGGAALFYSFVIAALFSLMLSGFMANFSDAFKDALSFRRMVGWISFIVMTQLLIAGLFLPLDFVYQSAIVFLIAMVFVDLVPSYIFGELSRVKLLATSSVIFVLLAIVAASARWSL